MSVNHSRYIVLTPARYENGRMCLDSSSDTALQIDIYRKRCGVNIVFLRFDDAARDLARAISIFATSEKNLHSSGLADTATVLSWLHSHSAEDPLQIVSKVPRSLKDLAIRIKFDIGIYRSTPEYDLPTISTYVGPLTLHVDAANYVSDIEVRQTLLHGRGLFARHDLKAGDLIMAEKAFALPGYFFNDRSSECNLYSLGDSTATDRAGALLFKELVQKLVANPSLRKEFFDMDDGGYWQEHGWEVPEDEETPVDV